MSRATHFAVGAERNPVVRVGMDRVEHDGRVGRCHLDHRVVEVVVGRVPGTTVGRIGPPNRVEADEDGLGVQVSRSCGVGAGGGCV